MPANKPGCLRRGTSATDLPGDCPSTEPVEGTACSDLGLACGGWGSFSCPETATCTPEGQWWIACLGLAFGGDAAMCGCPHPTE